MRLESKNLANFLHLISDSFSPKKETSKEEVVMWKIKKQVGLWYVEQPSFRLKLRISMKWVFIAH